jgi:hypothetical protein
MEMHRALVSSANSTTGEVYVKIPSVLGASESISLHIPTFFNAAMIPSVGDQIVVAIEGDNFNKVYFVSNLTNTQGSSQITIYGGSA